MMIKGTPVSLQSLTGPQNEDRFWYWHGASGRKYIHSIYHPDNCPPLPGAVYVAVKKLGGTRLAIAIGRFTPFIDARLKRSDLMKLRAGGVDEIHVHLLAKSSDHADHILTDLQAAFASVVAESLAA
jgi:hypothetical protein